MIKKIKQLNESLPGILFVDLIYLVIGEILMFVIVPCIPGTGAVWRYMTGFFAGVLYAVFCVFHMSFRIRRVVYGKANSVKTLLLGYMVRLLVMVAIFAVLHFFQLGDLLAALIGMFAMKVSAYLWPLVNKLKKEVD